MRRPVVLSLLTAALLATALAVVPAAGAAVVPGAAPQIVQHQLTRSCGDPAPGEVACKAVAYSSVTPAGQVIRQAVTPALAPVGLGPADIASAYKLPTSTGGVGQTVGVISAYDNPNAEADLAVYRAQYNLPPCTTANGCFRKVGQFGGSVLPAPDSGWAQESSLDLDLVSASCPSCKILLVEANDAALISVGFAENTAAFLGATVISNSFAATSGIFDFLFDFFFFNHPGIPITASSGDSGYGIAYPASSPYLTAVGGTSLVRANNSRGWSETAWASAGSGCASAPFAFKPPWQTDSGCGSRTVSDVSAVADPATGVAVYDSYSHNGAAGWQVFGGTSAAAPIIAGVYALAGNGSNLVYASKAYANQSALFDVVSGGNGSCGGSYLCTAGVGFDGPTGLGTPNGTGAF